MAYRRGVGSYVASIPCGTGTGPGAKAAGMGCACRGVQGCNCGMGAWMDGTGLFGTGLFAAGIDPSTWGIGEWAAVLLGGYMLLSVFHTTTTATRAARRKGKAVRRAVSA